MDAPFPWSDGPDVEGGTVGWNGPARLDVMPPEPPKTPAKDHSIAEIRRCLGKLDGEIQDWGKNKRALSKKRKRRLKWLQKRLGKGRFTKRKLESLREKQLGILKVKTRQSRGREPGNRMPDSGKRAPKA